MVRKSLLLPSLSLTHSPEHPERCVLRTQDSAPSPEKHVTVGRSRDSLTPNGSRAPLGKQSPDKSRDQARSLVPTPSRGDARRVYKAKEIHKTDLANGVMQTDMAKGRP